MNVNKLKRVVMCVVMVVSAVALAQKPPQAPVPPVPPVPAVPAMPPMPMMMGAGGGMMGPAGIPPALAQKVGISSEAQKKVRDLSFEANEQLISLEADLKRAQLDLEKALSASAVDESTVMNKLEVVSRAELLVRKNRMGLLVRIRKAIGPDAWEKLQAEMTGPGGAMFMLNGGPGMRREVRIIRDGNGGETVNVEGD